MFNRGSRLTFTEFVVELADSTVDSSCNLAGIDEWVRALNHDFFSL